MPFFVPVLRLSMLFLNIYDSYKVLKRPRPSARNDGQPSQRALSQRKRDMKGSLAVWIVWCCFITYERFAEAVVSLFVPFYDEFKSLAILFLILTRARGAEPIFLHILRPLLKPYTPTLDILLDLVCMIGDMIFVLFMFPIRFVLSWWEKSIFNRAFIESPETEGLSAERNNTHLNSNYVYPAVPGPAQPAVLQFPRKVSSDSSRPPYSRTASAESGQSSTQPDRSAQKDSVKRIPSNGTSNGHQSHQIWHPPPSAYSDADENIAAGAISNPANFQHDSDEDRDLLARVEEIARQEADEWRRYPPFPSAYPPTPVVTTSSRLPSNPSRFLQPRQDISLTEISEDESQQDFRGSLLPPRKPLNPSYVGLSDDSLAHPGVQSNRLVNDDMAIDSDSDMVDEEDEFNTTLRTPLPLLGSARSYVRETVSPTRPISFASSVASKTTVLTSAEGGSSLRTRSSSESLSSAALSMISSTESSSVVGKKRPLPQNTVNKGQAIATRGSPRKRGILSPPAHRLSHSRIARVVPRRQTVLNPSKESTSSVGDVDSQKDHNTKRRKIALPPGHIMPPVRHRITRYATPLRRATQPKRSTMTAPSVPTPSSIRLRTGLTANTPNAAKHANVPRPSSSSEDDPETSTRSREEDVAKTSD